ncbi:MAG: T9SS type A sorting domain-containing protein [Chitinophagaceae bacterium]|jgi:hypothetical protein
MKTKFTSPWKNIIKASLLTLACFLSSSVVNAQVSLTATSGTTSGSFTTLSDAFAAINAGTHKGVIAISITANTTEPTTVTPLYGSGTASASSSSYTSVSIKPSGGDWIINSASSPSANRGVIEFAGADNVTLDGDDLSTPGTRNLSIIVATGTTATAAVRVSSNSTAGSDGANNITIKNCNITGSRTGSTATNINYGIVGCQYSTTSLTGGAYNSQNMVIENNNITRTYRGIYLVGSSSSYPNTGLRIKGNIIGSSTPADNVGQYGIYCTYTATSTSATNSAIIEGNDIQCGDYATGFSSSVYGIYLSSYNYGMIIRKNNIHDIAQSSTGGWGAIGIYFGSTTNNDIRVENNFIRDITAQNYSAILTTSYQNYGIYVSSTGSGTIVNHNTIYLNKANATTYGTSNPTSACLVFSSSSSSLSQFYNNILINNQGGVSTNAHCVITSGTTNLPSTTNNNNYYCPSSGKIGYYSGASIASFSTWQSSTGLDALSINEGITFTSPTDLHITTGTTTMCESGGASVATTGVSVDIDNATRPGVSTYGFGTAPDIGADEFNGQVVYTCTTPAPGATISTPSTICLGQSVVLSLTSPTAGTGVQYQWQFSPDGITYGDIVFSGTSPTLNSTPSGIGYWRCRVVCKNGPDTTYSIPAYITYINNILSTTPNIRCGTGTVSLAATGTTGTTLNWYTTPAGGSPIGSGSPFSTPTISSTTNYYVGSETISTGSITIGTGTASSSGTGISPFSQSWESNRSQYLVLASELSALGLGSGNITAMSIPVIAKFSSRPFSNFTIKLGNTTASALTPSTYLSPVFTTVYGPATYSSVLGANNFSFGSSFYWDGSSNVVVDICFDNDPTSAGILYSSNDAVAATTKPYLATVGRYADNSSFCGTSVGGTFASTSMLPNFMFTGNLVCSSPRVLVTATVNTPPAFGITGTQTLCNNSVGIFSVTTPLSNFNTYSWSPVTGLYTDAACTTVYAAGTSASTVYFKSTAAGTTKYTCTANNSTTLCAATDTVLITNLPSTITAIATPSSVCVNGNIKLTLSPSSGYGAAGFVWQSSNDNSVFNDIIPAATTSSYTTPVISATKYYRVTLKSSDGATCLNSISDTGLVYNPLVNTSSGASRCGPGSVTLSATGSDGTINWFDVPAGGAPLASGTSFVTPTLTSTTTFYAEARATVDASYNVGTGTSTLSGTGLSPFSQYYESARTQYLVTAADLTASGLTAGQFSTMAFNVTSKSSTFSYKGYTVKLANTTVTTLTGFVAPTFTTVYGPTAYTPGTGSNVFPLSGGFSWDGSSNLLVEICFSNATGAYDGWSADDAVAGTTKTYTPTYGTYADNTYFCSGGTGSSVSSSILPNMVFTRLGCISSRTAVVATINTVPTPTISPATGPVQICAGNTATFTAGGGGTYQWKNASGILVGETGTTLTTGITGTYRVVVTTPSTGCKDSSVFVELNVNPTPTVSILPSGIRAICADSVQKYTSVATGSGLTYQWFDGGTLITGATRDSFSANTAGVYSLRVYLGTCSDTSNDATLIVNPLPAASFTKTGTTGAICLGSTLELTALSTPAGYTYQWMLNGIDISGATSRIYNAPTGGIYTVRIKDGNNCRKISDTMSIINTPMGIPDLSPKEVRFCEGTEIMLYSNAGPYAKLFSWTKDGTAMADSGATIATGIGGIYDVTVEDIYGCVLTSPKVSLTVDPLPTKPVITQTGTVLSTTLPYMTYQWYRNGKVIAGANKQKYTLMFDGYYHVVVTNNVNCLNSSDSVMIKNLSVQSISRNDVEIKVYPNPAQNQVTIDAPLSVNLSVKDITGKQVLILKDAKSVDMSVFADGIYIFTLTDNDGIILKMDKVMKRTN